MDINAEFFCRIQNSAPAFGAFFIACTIDLIKAGDCTANMTGICKRFLALHRKCKLKGG